MNNAYTQPYGLPTVWILDGRSMPDVSPLGAGAIYFDEATNKFVVSEDGGAYVNLIGEAETLAETLAAGNTTGGNDIVTR